MDKRTFKRRGNEKRARRERKGENIGKGEKRKRRRDTGRGEKGKVGEYM